MTTEPVRKSTIIAMISEQFPNVAVAQALTLTEQLTNLISDEVCYVESERNSLKWQLDDARDNAKYWEGVAVQRQHDLMDRNSEIASLRAEIARLNALDKSDLFKAAEGMEDVLRPSWASGKKIQAIKDFRNSTGVGLKEAKDTIDALFAKWDQQARAEGNANGS